MPNQKKNSAMFGQDVPLRRIFNAGIPEEIVGKLDIDYLIDIPNQSTALAALEWMQDQNNELDMRKRHTPEEMERAWRGVLRGCLAHGLAVPHNLRGFARRLGLVLTE